MTQDRIPTEPLILVVDDDETVRMICRKALMDVGFRVEQAENGQECLDLFSKWKPDLVLLDVMMPGLDGFETCRRLREIPAGLNTPIILMTALDDTNSINGAFDAGATDYLGKPIKGPILHNRVRYVLRNHQYLVRLWESETRLAHAERIARVGSWEWDLETGVVESSRQFREMLQFEPGSEITFDALKKRIPPDEVAMVTEAFEDTLQTGAPLDLYHRIVVDSDDPRVVHHQVETTLGKSGKPDRVFGTIQDVTELKKAEQRIHYLAYYDVLTGFPNRTLFKDRLSQAITRTDRTGLQLAVMFLDIDRFKRINDTLGHNIGDMLLRTLAERIAASVRETDSIARFCEDLEINTARLGGDEFTILLSGITYVQDPARVAQRVLDEIAKPFNLSGHEIQVTGSIGIALCPEDGSDVDTLLKHADAAMYHAKDQGRNVFKFYSKSINARAYERLVLENELRRAIDETQLLVYYQPQLDLGTGAIVGAEALVRWNHPNLGVVAPGHFLRVAEEMGIVSLIDRWVLREACAQNRIWRTAGLPPISVAVNVSHENFWQPGFVQGVREALRSTNLPSEGLEIELTEGIFMKDPEVSRMKIGVLKELGLKLSIDDFGTGYSSLSHMQRFACDKLKIDRSFVGHLETDERDAAIVEAVIVMAKALKLTIVAEGVETEGQLEFLRARGCDQLQGYLFSPPVPADEMTEMLATGRTLAMPAVQVQG